MLQINFHQWTGKTQFTRSALQTWTDGDHYKTINPLSPKCTFFQRFKEKCMNEVMRIESIITSHLSTLWKARFSILRDIIFLLRMQEKFDIDHSWEWRGIDYLEHSEDGNGVDQE